ncbi:hypothetical protein, partial [Serratia marcescens]|uniref:hypothetical protein n=1 Tax=Serratia marcescens TaxID=615 RepID=UPI00197D4218
RAGAAAGGIQRLALRRDRAAGRRDGQFCTNSALARVLERFSSFGDVCGDPGVLPARYFLKSACYISNLRLFLLYGIFKRSVSGG